MHAFSEPIAYNILDAKTYRNKPFSL